MQQFNPYLAHELERLRHAEIHAELEHERFLAEHGLDLWSVLRRSLVGWLRVARVKRERPAAMPEIREEPVTTIAA